MKTKRIILLLVLLFFAPTKLSAQEFYTFVGKSVLYLTDQKGTPDLKKNNGQSSIYQYLENEDVNFVFGVKNGKVYMAIKNTKSTSVSKAKQLSSIEILYYLSLGFYKQGTESGMTILKKGSRMLSIGYMNDPDGTYSTLVTAL